MQKFIEIVLCSNIQRKILKKAPLIIYSNIELSKYTIYKENNNKSKIYWHLIEKHKNKFLSYKDFKPNWDPDINILKEVKNNIKLKYWDKKNTVKAHLNVIPYILGRRNK